MENRPSDVRNEVGTRDGSFQKNFRLRWKNRCAAVRKETEGRTSPSESEVPRMRDAMRERAGMESASDEELFEVLIAISMVAKQLARSLLKKKEANDEQDE